jgi:feruloyl esterase
MKTLVNLTVAVLCAASPAAADTPDIVCSRLADMQLKDVQALSATTSVAEGDLPAFCKVTGTIRPSITFAVRFPLQNWNGKFYQTGCGGFCGQLITDSEGANAISTGLRRNYAVATMDGGHWGASNRDGRWAWNNPAAEDDWGWRATEETTRVAKAMVKEFYGQDPQYSYFEGCSTGGRMAHMVTLRQPDDFDGVLSGAPASDYPGLVATFFSWLSQANINENGSVIVSEADAALAGQATLASCDAADGIEDGVISDPTSCRPDFASVACQEGQEAQCLSSEKISAIERFMTAP